MGVLDGVRFEDRGQESRAKRLYSYGGNCHKEMTYDLEVPWWLCDVEESNSGGHQVPSRYLGVGGDQITL